jgi:hypothetical protein
MVETGLSHCGSTNTEPGAVATGFELRYRLPADVINFVVDVEYDHGEPLDSGENDRRPFLAVWSSRPLSLLSLRQVEPGRYRSRFRISRPTPAC